MATPPPLDPHRAVARKYYSYEMARQDPAAFARWWNYLMGQWTSVSKEIIAVHRLKLPTFSLRPGANGRFFESPIAINSLGFRGREIARKKGGAYRIVALGESTTFGFTLRLTDKPWPVLLEHMIQERLKPRRPVEVINAGVPAYTIEDNLDRLAKDVLPLHPDMIIAYHGYNGFRLLDESLPVVRGPAPPVYHARPVRLVANCDYRIKMLLYRRRVTARSVQRPKTAADVMDSKYARAYQELVDIARTNHIRLVLGNFSMAVNNRSDPDVIDFYSAGFPLVRWQISANRLHTALVQEIVRQHPEVCLVDTHPDLDGVHERFVDLVHMTQKGRQQLAENIFAGIKGILEEDLSGPDVPPAAP